MQQGRPTPLTLSRRVLGTGLVGSLIRLQTVRMSGIEAIT
jgi:hypothetical protein